jgi:serine/threonine protein kinase
MSDPVIGREIGSYQIVAVLGQGGMGKVYKAQHPYIGKQVAVKFLKSELSSKPDSVQRFFQEARAVNDIHHENVIDVLDFGKTAEGDYFILMELLLGKTLGDAIKGEAPFTVKRTGHICMQICSALAAAHENNIIHRDLKPDNIFLIPRAGQKDFVKVLDFGLAKLVDDNSGTHTTTGMVMGTPLYMAPEQALGRPLDAQTDVYALGVILYQMATGTVPFFDPNPVALATMHVTAKVPRPSERFSSVDTRLERIILKCLEKEKDRRYATMTAVAIAIAEACGLDTTPYFGVDLTARETFSSDGDELPTTSDADRTVITTNPTKPSPSSSGESPSVPNVPIERRSTEIHIDAFVNETSSLRAEITGRGQPAKGNKGLFIGIAFLLLLGVGVVLAFYSNNSETKPTPLGTAKQIETPKAMTPSSKKVEPQSTPTPETQTSTVKDPKDPKNLNKKDPNKKDPSVPDPKVQDPKPDPNKKDPKKNDPLIKDSALPSPFETPKPKPSDPSK